MKIYVSTIAFTGSSPEEMTDIARKNQWPLEFSSGMPYRNDLEEFYLNAPCLRMPHNYFPPPAVPFVLNLASSNQQVRQLSIDHCINGLKLSHATQAPFFAAHAGFCIDPLPNELGNKIRYDHIPDRAIHWKLFLNSLNIILTYADELQTDFLIENNVIASFNLGQEYLNPLLCCESQEITTLFTSIQHKRFGLLLDTAHLKVSCQTLGIDIEQEVEKIQSFVRGIHHSDNNGLVDDNQSITENYWFLKYLKTYKNLPQVLEVKNISPAQIHQQLNILHNYGR